MRVAAIQTETIVGDVDANLEGCERLANQAAREGAQWILLPEFFTTGMGFVPKLAECALLADGPVDFASNTLTIVTAPGNPKQVASFADLNRPDLSVVVCASEVPCGAATDKVEKATGTTLNPVSEESSVTDVLNKVTTGQADAGVVYVTDALGAGDKVAIVNFAESSTAVNMYPIAVLKAAPQPELAKKFVDAVTGEYGQTVLSEAGFAKP